MKWKKLLLLLILSPIISIALIVILNELAWAFSSNEVSSVEVVEFFPTYMYQDPSSISNEWNAKVSAVVYLPVEQDWLRKNVLSFIVVISEKFGFDGKVTKDRFDTFFRDFKRGKLLHVSFEKDLQDFDFASVEGYRKNKEKEMGKDVLSINENNQNEFINMNTNNNIDSSGTSLLSMITDIFQSDNNQKQQQRQNKNNNNNINILYYTIAYYRCNCITLICFILCTFCQKTASANIFILFCNEKIFVCFENQFFEI